MSIPVHKYLCMCVYVCVYIIDIYMSIYLIKFGKCTKNRRTEFLRKFMNSSVVNCEHLFVVENIIQ